LNVSRAIAAQSGGSGGAGTIGDPVKAPQYNYWCSNFKQ